MRTVVGRQQRRRRRAFIRGAPRQKPTCRFLFNEVNRDFGRPSRFRRQTSESTSRRRRDISTLQAGKDPMRIAVGEGHTRRNDGKSAARSECRVVHEERSGEPSDVPSPGPCRHPDFVLVGDRHARAVHGRRTDDRHPRVVRQQIGQLRASGRFFRRTDTATISRTASTNRSKSTVRPVFVTSFMSVRKVRGGLQLRCDFSYESRNSAARPATIAPRRSRISRS